MGCFIVLVDRTVNPMDPREPALYGTFNDEHTAEAKAEKIRRALARADVDRDVYVVGMYPGRTSLSECVEDAE